jgi:hypothetical protein
VGRIVSQAVHFVGIAWRRRLIRLCLKSSRRSVASLRRT